MAVFIHITRYFNHFHPLYLQPFTKEICHNHAKELNGHIPQSKIVVDIEVTEDACWNFAHKVSENEWKAVGLGGQQYDTNVDPPLNAIRDQSDYVGEICKKE